MKEEEKSETVRNAEVFSADYLVAKKDIDDAALNAHVLESLTRVLRTGSKKMPLQVAEFGAGIGTMLARLMERQVFTGQVIYRLTDNDATHLAAARKYLSAWAQKRNFPLSWSSEQHGHLRTSAVDLVLILEELDLRQLKGYPALRNVCDLILAHGVLDLFDLPQFLPPLLDCLKSGGLSYFSCNFDGETVFLPKHSADQQIIHHYHESMERRCRGASHTGRRLLTVLHDQQQEIVAAGSSDWVVHPGRSGYFEGHKLFLMAIIDMVDQELAKKPERIPERSDWTEQRRSQVADDRLFLLAKHLDILACQP